MPRASRAAVLVLSAMALVSSAAGVFFALRAEPSPQWGSFGYEIVIAVSCVFGVLLGTGRFQQGSGLAAGLIALTWFVGTGMGRLPFHNSPRGVISDPWFLGRTAASGAVALAGAYAVLCRDSRAWRRLVTGLLLLAPVGAFGAFWMLTGGGWLGASQEGGAGVVKVSALILIALVCGGLFCFGADSIIRAFGYGVPQGQPGAPEPIPAKVPASRSE